MEIREGEETGEKQVNKRETKEAFLSAKSVYTAHFVATTTPPAATMSL